MRLAAAVLLALFVAMAAIPMQACARPAHRRAMSDTPHDCALAGDHVCVGCATAIPDAPRPAAVPAVVGSGLLVVLPLARPAEWRPGFEPPPPRPSA